MKSGVFSFFLRPDSNARRERGIVLIEVLLSIVIFAVGVVAVQRTLIGSLAALGIIENWEEASDLLQRQVWEIERAVKTGESGTSFPQESKVLLGKKRTFQYSSSVLAASPDNKLMEGRAEISWRDSGAQRVLRRHFYILEPYENWKDKGI